MARFANATRHAITTHDGRVVAAGAAFEAEPDDANGLVEAGIAVAVEHTANAPQRRSREKEPAE